jgi:hypothetical protein
MRRITRLVSFWAFLLFAALVALQVFPYTGVFLMIVGAAFVTGLVLHVFLIALFVEAFVGRLPRYLIAIPIAAYSAYYAAFIQQTWKIAHKSAELRASNPGQVLKFDPDSQSLVTRKPTRSLPSTPFPLSMRRIRTSSRRVISRIG